VKDLFDRTLSVRGFIRHGLKLASALGLFVCAAGPVAAAPSVYPTGVTVYDPAKAYNSFVLFNGTDHRTYLIDMNGTVAHVWDRPGFPSKLVDPALLGGHKGVLGTQLSSISLLEALTMGSATGVIPGGPAQFRDKTFGYVDWEDTILWQWGDRAPGGNALQHHDWGHLGNGDTLILSSDARTLPGFGDRKMTDDVIYEVDQAGQTIWTWRASDHLDQLGFTPAEMDLLRHTAEQDYLHVNDMQVLGPNHWAEGGDNRFAPGNIMISSRDANIIAIIDRTTGAIVWHLGPDYPPRGSDYKPETTPRPVDQISGQHDAYLIPEGLPGAGNILLLDNQGEAGYPPAKLQVTSGSRVLEIDPLTMRIVWEYQGYDSGQANWSFWTPFIGSVQRLPNGNTLIDEGIDGRFFQVTRGGEIVWEYVSPYGGAAPLMPLFLRGEAKSNWVYRCQAVPYDWVPPTGHTERAVQSPDPSLFHVSP
jgi:hypothetical protein